MTTVANVNVAVTATGGGLDSGMAAAAARVNDFARSSERAVAVLDTKLKEQIATYGMTSDAIDVWRLKQKGASDEVVKGIELQQAKLRELRADEERRATAAQVEADLIAQGVAQERAARDAAANAVRQAEADKQARIKATADAVGQVEAALKRQIATYKLTATEIAVWDLKQKGATDEQIARVRQLQAAWAQTQQRSGLGAVADKVQAGAEAFRGLKQQAEALMPAFAMIAVAVHTVDKLAKGVDEAANAYFRGEGAASEMGVAALKAIPGVEPLYALEQAVYEAFWNGSAAIAKANGASEEFVRSLRTAKSLAADIEKWAADNAKFTAANQAATADRSRMEDEIALLRETNDVKREQLKIEQQLQKKLAEIDGAEHVTDRLKGSQREVAEDYAKAQREALDRKEAEKAAKEAEKQAEEAKRREEQRAETNSRIAEEYNRGLQEAEKKKAKAAEDAAKKQAEEAQRLKDSVRTKKEVYEDELARIEELRKAGAIDETTAERAKKKAAQDAAGEKKTTLAGVAERGSSEAFAASRRAFDRQDKVATESLGELQGINASAQQMAAAFKIAFDGPKPQDQL